MCRAVILILLFAAAPAAAADPLPPGAALRLGETRFRAGGEVRHLQFSNDGSTLAAWYLGWDGELHTIAWETATGSTVAMPYRSPPADPPIRALPAVLLDSDRVLTAGPGYAGRIWDASTARQLAILTGHAAKVTAVAASADGQTLATGSADGLVRLWAAGSLKPLFHPRGHTGSIRRLRVSPDGMRLLSMGDDQSARVWDLVQGRELRGFSTKGPAAFTADGLGVVMPKNGGGTIIRDIVTGLEMVQAERPASSAQLASDWLADLGLRIAVSPDGRMGAIAHADGSLSLIEMSTGEVRRRLSGHQAVCMTLAFTPDGTRLLTAGADQTVLVWGIRIQDVPLPAAVRQETDAVRLWNRLTRGDADAAYVAMARFAAEPAAAVKMARLRLPAIESAEDDPHSRIAGTRAIELLEALGTPASRELLEELAAGSPESHIAREARGALERLKVTSAIRVRFGR
jgi:WD40 repeat protein